MKLLLVIFLILFSVNLPASVSNNKYNNLVDDYNDLKESRKKLSKKYNNLVKKHNKRGQDYEDLRKSALSSLAEADKNMQCVPSGTFAIQIKDQLKYAPKKDLYTNYDIDNLNKMMNRILENRYNPQYLSEVIKFFNDLRVQENEASKNLGLAEHGIRLINRFIECSTNSKETKIGKRIKAELLISKARILEKKSLLNFFFINLSKAYSSNIPYKKVFNTTSPEASLDKVIFDGAMGTLTKFIYGSNTIAGTLIASTEAKNSCSFTSTIKGDNGNSYTLELDFSSGLGWSVPNSNNNYFEINENTAGNNLYVNGNTTPIKNLKHLYLDKSELIPMLNLFRRMHKKCRK